LQGIQQFQRLRVLSAADNLLPDLSCLEVLTECPGLQVRHSSKLAHSTCQQYMQHL
jgi:hypothetical protein